jgi:membrane dipeptidase
VDLVRQSTVIDMLGLLTLNYPRLLSWEQRPATFTEKEVRRLKESGITILHPAVGHISGDIAAACLEDITGWNALIAAHPHCFVRVDGPEQIEQAKRSGRIGVILGQQNSGHFQKVDDVDRFYRLGQRVSQLTYRQNRLGGGSSDAQDIGLTSYGTEIVARMNQVGMAIDVSHCGDRTTLDAIAASKAPVLATHSNCRKLSFHHRCKTDEAIKTIAARGGVVGITMIRGFVQAGGRVTIEHVLNHVEHVIRLAGVEHAGIGSDVDFNGRDSASGPKRADLDGIDYTRKIFEVTEGLVRRGYSDPDIALVLGGNFNRALRQIWT